MREIDRAKVRIAFDRGSCSYDETVVVQKRVIERILAELKGQMTGPEPKRVLDVGAGTGLLLRSLRGIYGSSQLVGIDLAPGMGQIALSSLQGSGLTYLVEGDAERLPFLDCSFDLVLSTSTFQWLNSLETTFSEVLRVLSPGGTFRFALFGGETLWELRTSHHAALRISGRPREGRMHSFFSLKMVDEALLCAGFSNRCTESRREVEYHEDVPHLLRSLKRIGAGNASSPVAKGLAETVVIKKMMEIYQREHGGSTGIPATYEVIYGLARKA